MENCHILGVMAGSEHLKTAEVNAVVGVALVKKLFICGTVYLRLNLGIPEES